MWEVSISTTRAAEEEIIAGWLEKEFNQPPAIYCDADTGASSITVFPARLPCPASVLKSRCLKALRHLLGPALAPVRRRMRVQPLPRKNWAESWKYHFKPIEVGSALLIKPSWSRRRARPGQHVITLDPGLSFGTGHHATTLFCLQRLAACRVPGLGQSFLDIGTGSGILAIAAAKLGYTPVRAFDNDPASIRVSRQNVKRNRVQAKVKPVCHDLASFPQKQKYDVICANLVCELLVKEASNICKKLSPGGRLIAAGILKNQFPLVAKTFARFGLTLELAISDKTWQSGQFVLS